MARNTNNMTRYTNEKAPLSRDEMRRLHTKKKKRQKKRKRILTYIFLLLAIIGVGVALSLTVFFHIAEIEVQGNEYNYYTDEGIIESAGITLGDNLFMLNSSKVKQNVEQLNPYVGNAEIIKKIPDKVIINIKEAVPSFAISNGESYIIISDTAKMLEQVPEKPEGVTLLTGVSIKSCQVGTEIVFENSQTMAVIKDFISACEQAELTGITSVDVSDLSDIYAVYDGRITLHIGVPSNLNKKLPLAREIIKRQENDTPGQYGEINLTVLTKGYFKKTEPPSTTAEATTKEETTKAEDSQTTSNQNDSTQAAQ